MNTFTFEQAVVMRLTETPTWNLEQAQLALRTLWKVSPAVKSDLSGQAVKLFLKLLEENLKAVKFTFFHLPQVLVLYTEACKSTFNPTDFVKEATTMTTTPKAIQTVSIFTDGSCNVPAKTGGWGVHISMEGSDKFKAMSGSVKGTTNNLMELQAMIEGIKAVTIKEGFIYEFATDSKYVLQSLANKDKNLANNFAKMKNEGTLKALYKALDDKGIVLTELTQPVMGNNTIQSGDVVHTANNGIVLFKWIKGHSDHPGNDEADRLALTARKLLDKTGKETSDASGSKPVQKAVVEVSEPPVARVVTEAMIRGAKTFEDIKHILSLSETLELGGTCGEDFTYYTAVLHNGKSVFEIVSPERVSSREGYIKDAAGQLVKYLVEEGIYYKDSIDLQEAADQIEEIMKEEAYDVVEDIQESVHTMLGDMEATPVVPSKERFSSMLEDLDKDSEESFEHVDAKDAIHDSNFDLWQAQIQESSEIKTLTEFFDIEPSDIVVSRDTYESFYEDVRVEHDLKSISDALFIAADKYYRWLPSLLLEEELDAMAHKDTSAKARRSINEQYQANCDALDVKVKEMEEEAMASTFKPLTEDLIQDVIVADPFVKNFIGEEVVPMSSTKVEMFQVCFEQEYTGRLFKAFSEAEYPIKTWADCELTYIPFEGELPEDLIKTQDCDGLDMFFTQDQYDVWAEVFDIETPKSLAASILDVVIPEEVVEYGFVVYESDAVTMDNSGGDFEEVEVFVKVVPEGYLHEGVVYPSMDAVVQYSESTTQYKSCCSPILRPASQVEIDLAAVERYNELNSSHDFSYMFSDDSRSHARGRAEATVLKEIERTLTPIQKDLTALYNNHVLGRNCQQFGKTVSNFENTAEVAAGFFE